MIMEGEEEEEEKRKKWGRRGGKGRKRMKRFISGSVVGGRQVRAEEG